MAAATATIPLSGKHGFGKVAIVDKRFEKEVKKHSWWVRTNHGHVAVFTTISSRRDLNMGRFILELSGEVGHGLTPDHADRNPFNNTLTNLRFADRSEQMRNRGLQKTNTSGFRGVSWRKEKRKWECSCRIRGRRRHLGYFKDVKAAARAYNEYLESSDVRDEFKVFNEVSDSESEE